MFGWKRSSQGPGGRQAEGRASSSAEMTPVPRAEAASTGLLGHTGLVTWPLGLLLERAPIVHASRFKEPDSRTDFIYLF